MRNGELTTRQESILKLIGKFRFISEQNIANYLGVSLRATKEIGYRLRQRKLIRIETIFHNGDRFLLLDKLSCDYYGFRYHKTVSPGILKHDNYVHQIAISEMTNGNKIKLEHEAKYELDVSQIREVFLPDILINDSIAYEVELSIKFSNRLITKINKYNLDNQIKEVKWISDNKNVLDKVNKFAKNSKHKFYIFDENIIENINYIPQEKTINLDFIKDFTK